MGFILENVADSDEMRHTVAFHLCISFCSKLPLYGFTVYERVKHRQTWPQVMKLFMLKSYDPTEHEISNAHIN